MHGLYEEKRVGGRGGDETERSVGAFLIGPLREPKTENAASYLRSAWRLADALGRGLEPSIHTQFTARMRRSAATSLCVVSDSLLAVEAKGMTPRVLQNTSLQSQLTATQWYSARTALRQYISTRYTPDT